MAKGSKATQKHAPKRGELLKAANQLKICIAEHRAWDATYCEDALASLQGDYEGEDEDSSEDGDANCMKHTSPSGEFVWTNYGDNNMTRAVRMAVIETHAPEAVPHPRYEACTPTSRNIKVGDDPEAMVFPPFADDPSFDYHAYSEEFELLEWALPRSNPDHDLIFAEVIRRLMRDCGFQAADIDGLGLFPAGPSPETSTVVTWMSQKSQHRDYPNPLPPGWEPKLPFTPPHSTAGPAKILHDLSSSFCHNTSCLTGYCTTHLGKIPEPVPQTPSLSVEALASSVESACGQYCFLIGDLESIAEWTEEDEELLRVILEQTPDSAPCDLAVICRLPCFEVFKRQSEYLTAASSRRDRAAKKRKGGMLFTDSDAYKFKPCVSSHTMSVFLTSSTGRSHAAIQDHATAWRIANAIRTALTARRAADALSSAGPRQWKGCNCKVETGKKCDSKKCPCAFALRECDPRVCRGCTVSGAVDRIDSSGKGWCGNMSIQLGLSKHTKVRPSRYGSGLFIMEDAEPGDLISEYTGELIYEPTVQTRDHSARHTKRNYVFSLNSKVTIDSMSAGNEARFINHHETNYNCRADILMVNGEHRIGFFAIKPIKKGTELLINYGRDFFQPTHQNEGALPAGNRSITAATPKRKGRGIGNEAPLPREENSSDISYQPSATSQSTSSGVGDASQQLALR